METQRQWSDSASARPPYSGSLIALWAHDLHVTQIPTPRSASWYPKPLPTFGDALAIMRRELWVRRDFPTSAPAPDLVKLIRSTLNCLIDAACCAA
jgi:hypothetical protein